MPKASQFAKRSTSIDRRALLLGTAVSAAVVQSAAHLAHSQSATEPDLGPGDDRSPRYRETEHIRAYYDRSRF